MQKLKKPWQNHSEVTNRYYLLLLPLILFFALGFIGDTGDIFFSEHMPSLLKDWRHQQWQTTLFWGYLCFLFLMHMNPALGYKLGFFRKTMLRDPALATTPAGKDPWFFMPALLANASWIALLLVVLFLPRGISAIVLVVGFILAVLGPAWWVSHYLNRAEYDKGLHRLDGLAKYHLMIGAPILRGVALTQAGRFKEAQSFFEAKLAATPNPAVRRMFLDGLARAYIGLGNLEKAQQLLEESATITANNAMPSPSGYTKLALVLLEQNRTLDVALRYTEKALEAQRKMQQYPILGKAIYFLDKSEPAKRHLLRAWALSALGRESEAESDIRLALPVMNPRIKSDYADLCYLLARVLVAQNKPQEAKDYLRKAIDADPVGGAGIIAKRFFSQAYGG